MKKLLHAAFFLFAIISSNQAKEYTQSEAFIIFQIDFHEMCKESPIYTQKTPLMCNGQLTEDHLRQNIWNEWTVSFHPTEWLYEIYTLKPNGEIVHSTYSED